MLNPADWVLLLILNLGTLSESSIPIERNLTWSQCLEKSIAVMKKYKRRDNEPLAVRCERSKEA